MSGFNGLWDLKNAINDGKIHYSTFRKAPPAGTQSNIWFDLSMSPGFPSPQYYASAPLIGTQMKKSVQGGLNHGTYSADKKFLNRIMAIVGVTTPLPLRFILCDYLMYYPFIDTGTTDVQVLDNTVTLPRYTTGEGVQAMIVTVAPCGGAQPTLNISYTNSEGTSGRTSGNVILSTAVYNGAIMSNIHGGNHSNIPFLPLQSGDKGIRSVESVTISGTPDIGLLSLVLVRPLFGFTVNEITAPTEKNPLYGADMPIIHEDAYLNFLLYSSGSLVSNNLLGEIETIWS